MGWLKNLRDEFAESGTAAKKAQAKNKAARVKKAKNNKSKSENEFLLGSVIYPPGYAPYYIDNDDK